MNVNVCKVQKGEGNLCERTMNSGSTQAVNKNDEDCEHLCSAWKSVSSDNVKANSCIELCEIRKLDSLLNQCESISCDNLLLYDEIYNYELCDTNKRKYYSTTAINKVPPKHSIRGRTHKRQLGIYESEKIIKHIDKIQKNKDPVDKGSSLCDPSEQRQLTYYFDNNDDENDDDIDIELFVENLISKSCSHLLQRPVTINKRCIDKTIQTPDFDLYDCCNNNQQNIKYLLNHCSDNTNSNSKATPTHNVESFQQTALVSKANTTNTTNKLKRKSSKRKRCSCRNYDNVNFICETSLTVPKFNATKNKVKSNSLSPLLLSMPQTSKHRTLNNVKKSLMHLRNDKNGVDGKSFNDKCGRLTKQKTIIDVYDDEGVVIVAGVDSRGVNANGGYSSDGYCDNRVININEKSIEIIPISMASSYSQPATPRSSTIYGGNGHETKSDKSETQSQKSKRSKFSPSFISRKLTSRLNSDEDGAGGAKESLLGRSKSVDMKLPEPVETVRINNYPFNHFSLLFILSFFFKRLMIFPFFIFIYCCLVLYDLFFFFVSLNFAPIIVVIF